MVTGTDTSSAAPWLQTAAAVEARMGADVRAGLTAGEAAARLDVTGPNELVTTSGSSIGQLIGRQFLNTMILILAVAAAVTFVVGDRTDTLVIAVIVVLNAGVGFVQEYRAERAMEELDELTAATARALRDGDVRTVPAADLVPGDVVRLGAGDVVPADLRLVSVADLHIAEAALTGESQPVRKSVDPIADEGAYVGDRLNMAFKGTAVTAGRGDGIVIATGMDTELGRIAAMLATERAATPLQRRLGVLGRRLAAAALVLCAVVFVLGVLRGEPASEMFITAVSLAVAAIPESLPAVLTVALALGARRMARRRALVRRLPAVETLGAVTVICTDKTGTLTQNRMAVEHVWTRHRTYHVTGTGYDPTGSVDADDGDGADDQRDDDLYSVGAIAASCNDAALHAPDGSQHWEVTGDPTEGALLVLARRIGSDLDIPRVAEIPFDADRRRMTTVSGTPEGDFWVATKGALDALVPLLRPDEPVEAATEAAERLAEDGYRVLALAERELDTLPPDLVDAERDLRLAGVVGISDPPRPEAAQAISTCRTAGITTVMITGDHPSTATAIASRIGLLDGAASTVMTGREVDDIDDDELTERVADVRVFARSAPEQKLRIVDAWRRRGAIVAMTGDGVNDAPALQRADIGVAMGITGTDVSREAADMVLADDNFATIVAAAAEGRRIYDNLRRFVRYMLTSNTGEVLVVLLGPFFGLPVPLTAAQILWINLVTDGLPAVALGLERAEPDTMQRPPRRTDESILARGLWQQALTVGTIMMLIVLPLQIVGEQNGMPWQTMGFLTLAFLQLGNALAVRSETQSTRSMGWLSNRLLAGAIALSVVAQLLVVYVPFLQTAFDTEPLSVFELAVVAVLSGGAFVSVEIDKARRRRRSDRMREDAGS